MTPLSIPSPPFNSFALGPFTIHIYALTMITGMVAAYLLTARRWKARGGQAETVQEIILWAIPLGIVGARLYHVATHWEDYFFIPGRSALDTLIGVVAIWQGGNAIFGSILGGAIGAWIAARRMGARFDSFADAVAPGLLLAQVIGRLGNWFNQELFGGPDNGPLGLEIAPPYRPPGYETVETFQPTFLYEMAWNLAGVGLLLWVDRRWRLGYGKLFALYMVVYGTGRFLIEAIRTDFTYWIGPFKTNQFAALVFVVLGVALFVVQQRRRPGREPWVEKSQLEDAPDDSLDDTPERT